MYVHTYTCMSQKSKNDLNGRRKETDVKDMNDTEKVNLNLKKINLNCRQFIMENQ